MRTKAVLIGCFLYVFSSLSIAETIQLTCESYNAKTGNNVTCEHTPKIKIERDTLNTQIANYDAKNCQLRIKQQYAHCKPVELWDDGSQPKECYAIPSCAPQPSAITSNQKESVSLW